MTKWLVTRLILILLFICIGSAAIAGERMTELRLGYIPSKEEQSPISVAQRRVFEAFCARYPQIKVKVLTPFKIEGANMESQEFMAVAGGVAPDVFVLYGRKISAYRTQGFLYPLNDYLGRYAEQNGKPFCGVAAIDQIWRVCIDRGDVFAIPSHYYALALQCYKPAFARAGLASRVPKDWDELYTFARHMTRDPSKEQHAKRGGPIQYGLSMLTGYGAGWHFLQYVWSSSGEVVAPYYATKGRLLPVPEPPLDFRKLNIRISNEADYYRKMKRQQAELKSRGLPTDYSMDDIQWRLMTNTPAAMKAFEFFRKLAHQPWLRNGDHEFDITLDMFRARKAVDPATGESFDLNDPAIRKRIYWGVTAAADAQSGRTTMEPITYAMEIAAIDTANTADPKSVMYAPFPSRKGRIPAAFVSGHYLGMNAAISPEAAPGRRNVRAIRDAAWKYIEFVTGPEAQRITVSTLVDFDVADYARPSLLKNAGYSDILERIPEHSRELWYNLENFAHVEPYCPGFTNVQTREMGMAIEALLNDAPDPTTGEYRRNLQGIMDGLVHNVNAKILGKMSDAEVNRRSRVGWVIFAVMALGLAMGTWKIIQMMSRSAPSDNEGFGVGGHPARKRIYAWMFLLPAVVTVAVWAYYPLVRGMIMAFQDYRILGGSSFVGLRNFVEAVSDPKFWRYLLQSLQYMVMCVGIGFLIPIGLAILLTEIPKGKVLLRTIYYLPAVTTGVVTLFLWKGLMYNATDVGVINKLILWFNLWPLPLVIAFKLIVLAGGVAFIVGMLMQARHAGNTAKERWLTGIIGGVGLCLMLLYFGNMLVHGGASVLIAAFGSKFEFKSQTFLRDPNLAMLWVIIPTIWAGAGPGCLIYLAALKGIPDEQYEAADLDGAGIWHKVMHVIYPNLAALIVINLIGSVVAGLKESSNIFVMTGGGPEDATMTAGLYIWYNAFMFLNFGLSTAMAWIVAVIVIGFTLKQLQILDKIQFRNTSVDEQTKDAGG